MSLNVVDVRHRYRPAEPLVLDGVHLRVEPGEVVALVGPSGSGKTTLLAISGGLLVPSAGGVELCGRPLHRHRLRTEISWVFQGTNALPTRTVIDNVVVRGLAHGLSRGAAEAEARARLDEVGLAALLDRSAGTLSGGELQRMCVARALMGDPALVCADEPTGQLDAAATETVVQALTRKGSQPGDARARRRAMVLIATHDMAVAQACDRVVALADGCVGVPA